MITIEVLNELRAKGYRPGVVGVFVNNKKVLLLHKIDWKLWLFPQGRIDVNESVIEALNRQMTEELGSEFVATWSSKPFSPELIFEDQITLNTQAYETPPQTDLQGKHYYYFVIQTDAQELNMDQSVYDEYKWVTFDEAVEISTTIYQKNKRKALIKVLNLLLQKGYIS